MVCELTKEQEDRLIYALVYLKRLACVTLHVLQKRDEKVDVFLCCTKCNQNYEFKKQTLFHPDSMIYNARFLCHFLIGVNKIELADLHGKYGLKDLCDLYHHIQNVIHENVKRIENEHLVKSNDVCTTCSNNLFVEKLEYYEPLYGASIDIDQLTDLLGSVTV